MTTTRYYVIWDEAGEPVFQTWFFHPSEDEDEPGIMGFCLDDPSLMIHEPIGWAELIDWLGRDDDMRPVPSSLLLPAP